MLDLYRQLNNYCIFLLKCYMCHSYYSYNFKAWLLNVELSWKAIERGVTSFCLCHTSVRITFSNAIRI